MKESRAQNRLPDFIEITKEPNERFAEGVRLMLFLPRTVALAYSSAVL